MAIKPPLIAYLHTRQYISLARISEFFCSVYGMGISKLNWF
ncbi:hypothetical protein [Pedobacter sp. JCM 36344]